MLSIPHWSSPTIGIPRPAVEGFGVHLSNPNTDNESSDTESNPNTDNESTPGGGKGSPAATPPKKSPQKGSHKPAKKKRART